VRSWDALSNMKLFVMAIAIMGLFLFARPLDSSATVPGQNGPIVFAQDADADLFIADAFRTGTQPTAIGLGDQPAWNPGSQSIVYVAPSGSNLSIWNRTTNRSRTVLESEDQYFSRPTFTPDGKAIVYVKQWSGLHVGPDELRKVSVDGSGDRLLLSSSSGLGAPDVSPDGSRIAYVAGSFGDRQIHIMDADGSNDRILAEGAYPSFSPDGFRVAFVRDADQVGVPSVVFSIGVSGSRITQITDQAVGAISPVFSPDGRRIAFSLPFGPKPGIYASKTDGSNPRRIVKSIGPVELGDWGRSQPFVVRNRGSIARDRRIKVRPFARGSISLRGNAIKSVKRATTSGAAISLPIRFKKRPDNRAFHISLRIRFEPRGALASSRDLVLRFPKGK